MTACRRIEEAGRAIRESCLILADDEPVSPSLDQDGLIQLKRGSMSSWMFVDSDSQQCVVVDPFEELAERIETLESCRRLKVLAILDTHQHVDHVSFVCRSSNHSGQAAEVSRRLGINHDWHVTGGIALGEGRHNDVSLDCAEMEYVI